MASVNKVILIGNLGKDPELRRTASGSAVVNFSIATTEKFKGKDGQMQESTEWHSCICWGKRGEAIAQYCTKGSSIYLEGKIVTRSWEKDGVKKYATEIIVSDFRFLGGKSKESQIGQQLQQYEQQQGLPQQQIPVDEDLPF